MKTMDCLNTWGTARHLPYVSLLLAAVAVLLVAWPGAASWLQYERGSIAAGEWWRMLTGHWTHASVDHVFWDVMMFMVLGIPCERRDRCLYGVCVAAAAGLIPLVLWVAQPGLQMYRGLSGLDSALFALLASVLLTDGIRQRHWPLVAVLVGLCLAFAGKVGYEWIIGSSLFVDSQAAQMTPVPLAHAVGAAVGALAGLLDVARARGRADILWGKHRLFSSANG